MELTFRWLSQLFACFHLIAPEWAMAVRSKLGDDLARVRNWARNLKAWCLKEGNAKGVGYRGELMWKGLRV